MAIQMTREEYRQKFGYNPPIQETSTIDEAITPVQMTRAEYDAKYRPSVETAKTTPKFGLNMTGTLVDTPNYLSKVYEAGKAGVERIKSQYDFTKEAIKNKNVGDTLSGIGQTGLGVLETVSSPITGALTTVGNIPLGQSGMKSGDLVTKPIELISQSAGDTKLVQKIATLYPRFNEDLETLIAFGTLFIGGPKVKGLKLPEKTPVKATIEKPPEVLRIENLVNKSADEIYKIENAYTKKLKNSLTDEGHQSRQRIAESNVLVNSVDNDGLIRTKQAGGPIDQYKKLRLEGTENIVRNNLEREGKTINIRQIENALTTGIDRAGLEGADLVKAIRGLEKEVQGLKMRADETGEIPLYRVQDFKTSAYNNINYNVDSTPTIALRKAKARVYKEIIEDNSNIKIKVGNKTYGVKDVNMILGRFLDDVERLALLDGKRVRGGRLGKYFSQISGNIIGATAGGAVGGPIGTALGTIVGGEAGGFIRGRQMKGTFGKGIDVPLSKNPVLEKAIAEGKLPKEVDLTIADKKLGVPKGITKNREMLKVENQIKKNVEKQKVAIKEKNFDLVIVLKEIYQSLITKLKELIGVSIKNKEGGFIKVNQSNKDGNLNTQYNKTAIAKTTAIETNYTTKLKTKKDIVIRDVAGNKNTIPAGTLIKAGQGKGSNMVLKVGDKTYTLNKGQFDNLKGQSILDTKKKFAPELEGTEESVRGTSGRWVGNDLNDIEGNRVATLIDNEDGTWSYESDFSEGSEKFKTKALAKEDAVSNTVGNIYAEKGTKYDQYQLPNGKNYREILIKAPQSERLTPAKKARQDLEKLGIELEEDMDGGVYPVKDGEPIDYDELPKSTQSLLDRAIGEAEDAQGFDIVQNFDFKSSHWDEPNVISHLRINDRTYNGKKLVFMEELQSDWAREARAGKTEVSNPLLKNWQVPTIKRALQDAVQNKAKYFAWINGEQTSARYNLATQVEKVDWRNNVVTGNGDGTKLIYLNAKSGRDVNIRVDSKTGIVKKGNSIPADWEGKKLDEVLGKGLADKIMEKESGTLSGEGLKFGGEWASNLYDKQVKNIVEDLTGAKVKEFDLGLPVEKTKQYWSYDGPLKKADIKIGGEVYPNTGARIPENTYKITEILGDGKFKAESVKNYGESIIVDLDKTQTKQQGIELTPEVKAIIKGESPLKNEGKIGLKTLGAVASVPLIFDLLFNKEEK